MDVIFDWNLGNMIYNGLIILRHYGFPFAEIEVVSVADGGGAATATAGAKGGPFPSIGVIELSNL